MTGMRVIDGVRAMPVKPVLAEPLDDISVRRPESCETRGVYPAEVMDLEMRGVSDISVRKSHYQPVQKALEQPISYGQPSARSVKARDAEAVPGKEERMKCRPADREMTLGELFQS